MHVVNIICKIMDWQEAPRTIFCNPHQDVVNRKRIKVSDFLTGYIGNMSDHDFRLHMYISKSYPSYFGVSLRVGRTYDPYTTYRDD